MSTNQHTTRGARGHRRRRGPVAVALAGVLLVGLLAGWLLLGPAGQPETAPAGPAQRCVTAAAPQSQDSGLEDPAKVQIARQLIASAENSTLDWESAYGYLQYDVEGNPQENRGYTGGIVGFTSKTHDMLLLVRRYSQAHPDNPLAQFLPALAAVDGTSSAEGLGQPFETAWRQAAQDSRFQQAQRDLTDEMYLGPAVAAARQDGLGALGQFVYVDTLVMHGSGTRPIDFGGIREFAHDAAMPPSRGGDEVRYLEAFLDRRGWAMTQERGHQDTSRVAAQRQFLAEGNLSLTAPLHWRMYGDAYTIAEPSRPSCS